MSLQYRETDNELWLYSDIGPAAGRSQALYEKLLQANLFWRQTSGATLSLSGDEPPHVVLAQSLYWVGMDSTGFGVAVETFVNTVERWLEQFGRIDSVAQAGRRGGALPNTSDGEGMELIIRSRA